jgi:exopolyphosphatase/guanosine-5'-triphosphate,3'-diphosphate pyrophosphatase
MKLAAIDLGSNSIHMVIVEVGSSGAFRVVDREKHMVRLGAGALGRGRLDAAAVRRSLGVLAEYRRLCQSHAVDKVIALATSAVREARNGEDFLELVGRETRIWPKAVSGAEEARLIYLAALHSIHLEGRRALVIDIGGGSLELALGAGRQLENVVSEKLGVLRATEAFVHSDPLSSKDEARLVARVEEALAPHEAAIRASGFERAVGTSGTILALGALASQADGSQGPESLHHVSVSAEAIRAVRKRLVASSFKERLRMRGLDEVRADIIVAGAVILDTLMERLGVRELTLCEWALREGILLDYIERHPRSLARAEAYPDVRRRSVVALAERCLYDEAHARHVATLATALFDATHPRHGLSAAERDLLEYAALLHDVGHHISYPGHHKHSYYLIKNGDLRGFSPAEIEVIANVARYHRRGMPRKGHAPFGSLPKAARGSVRLLAGLLRVADALDRSHRQTVRALRVSLRSGTLRVVCQSQGNCELELWGAPRRADLLEQALGVRLRFDLGPVAASAAAKRLRA